MQHRETHRNALKYAATPVLIEGTKYFLLGEVANGLGISRTTVWRWRKEGKIPLGRRFRDGRILLTQAEVTEFLRHANSLEPVNGDDPAQLKLFPRRDKK